MHASDNTSTSLPRYILYFIGKKFQFSYFVRAFIKTHNDREKDE